MMSGITWKISPMDIVVVVGFVVAGVAIWRGKKAVEDAIGWVTDIPEKVTQYAKEGGGAFLDTKAPALGEETGYRDVLTNADGMDFRYF